MTYAKVHRLDGKEFKIVSRRFRRERHANRFAGVTGLSIDYCHSVLKTLWTTTYVR